MNFLTATQSGMSLGTLVSDTIEIITSIFGFITSNWLLISVLGFTIVVPMVFSVYQYFKSR